MIALGSLPDEDAVMGIEASGVVVDNRFGATAVSRSATGSWACSRTAPARSPITDQRLLVKVPAGWSHTAAATTSVVFATAFYALVDLAGPVASRGSGCWCTPPPVGWGWLRCSWPGTWGLEVFATASRGKWDTLRAMGFDDDHIADSRSLEFEDKFRAVTGGRGVDVVLDSLAGDFVDASLRLVAPGGVFLEMGKTDIRDPGRRRPGVPRCALPRLRPLRSRTGPHPADARRAGRAVRRRRAAAVAGDHV